METKDLVLLMLIPVILISIIYYTNMNPVITGYAVAQQDESNEIGTYSIMPSFRARVEYNLKEEYEKIIEQLNQIISDCKGSDHIEKCFQDRSTKLSWNCEEPQDEVINILYDFMDKFNECLNLKEDGVVCRFSLDDRYIIDTQFKSYEIRLTYENQKTRLELLGGSAQGQKVLGAEYINLENLVYTVYDYKDTFNEKVNPVKIIVEFQDKKPIVKEAFAFDDNSNRIPLSVNFIFYKKNKVVKFIEQGEENKYLAPDPQGKIGLPKLIDLPRTKGLRFCAKTGTKFYVYDKSDNTVKLRDVVYKFAVTFPNPPTPPPIKPPLKAEDKQKAEKSIILKWNKAKWDDGSEILDFDHYNIYCSKTSLQDKTTKEIRLDNLKPIMAVKADANYDEWVVEINKCGKDAIEDNADYYFAVTAVSTADKESKATTQSNAKSIDDLAPGLPKIILVNSDQKKVEGTSSACIDLPKAKDSVPGHIKVTFLAPEKNEDGETTLDLTQIQTYFLHFYRAIEPQNLKECKENKCEEFSKAQQNGIDNIDILKRTFTKFSKIDDPEFNNAFSEGQTYCFKVVAKDKNQNIIDKVPYSFESPSQWSKLSNAKKGIFDENGDIVYS